MVDLKDKKLNKELKKLEHEEIPSLEDIEEENRDLEKKEKEFMKKYLKK